jgi:hypothetical protein
MKLLLAAAAAVVCHGAPPKPRFSWDTVPLFQHLASVNASFGQEFPPARLAWLAASAKAARGEHDDRGAADADDRSDAPRDAKPAATAAEEAAAPLTAALDVAVDDL